MRPCECEGMGDTHKSGGSWWVQCMNCGWNTGRRQPEARLARQDWEQTLADRAMSRANLQRKPALRPAPVFEPWMVGEELHLTPEG